MSLITRCPQCRTKFRLVPDQLRISAGWVRCGKCSEVFDASSHMLGYAEAEDLEADLARRQAEQDQARAAQAAQAMERSQARAVDIAPSVAAPPPAAPTPAPALDASAAHTPAQSVNSPDPMAAAPGEQPWPSAGSNTRLRSLAADEARAKRRGQSVRARLERQAQEMTRDAARRAEEVAQAPLARPQAEAAPVADAAPAVGAEPELARASESVQTSAEATQREAVAKKLAASADLAEHALDASQASFVRLAERRAFWRSRPVRAMLGTLVLCLTLALAGQVAWRQRDWLAAAYPPSEPALRELCRWSDCQLMPYRWLEAVSVDSSSFNRINGAVYQLSISLHSKAKLPVAMPWFELSLTDAQDRAVLRRVVKASEVGAPVSLPAGGDFTGTARLTLTDPKAAAAVVGYRVLAFYP